LPPPEAWANAEPTEPTFATVSADAGRSEAAEHAAIDHPIAELSTRGKAAEESEPTFAGREREGGPPAENAAEKPEEVGTATGGGEPRRPPGPQVGGASIDTRIAPSFGPPGKKPPRKLTRSLSPLGGPAKQAGAPAASRRLSALPGSVVINAIGARVEDRVRAAMARANASGNGPRNAVGNTITTNAGNAASGAAESVVINAIGMAVHVHPAVSPPANGAVGSGATAVPGGRRQRRRRQRHRHGSRGDARRRNRWTCEECPRRSQRHGLPHTAPLIQSGPSASAARNFRAGLDHHLPPP
jgi:hypothetical protein